MFISKRFFVLMIFLTGCAGTHTAVYQHPPHVIESIEAVVKKVPDQYQLGIEFALYRAKANSNQMITALQSVSGEELVGMAFLITYMPIADLLELKADYLIENVKLAYAARREAPWGKEIPEEIFLNYVLPYVNVNEKREKWRRTFYDRYISVAQEKQTIEASAIFLNTQVLEDHSIKYDIKNRPKPDQGPLETIEAGIASCTGLSIMISDVLRSISIPVRVVGTPLWSSQPGNHTWFEVWDQGKWYYLDAGAKGGYNETWFIQRAGQIEMTEPQHRIYAVSFKRTDTLFPTIWDPYVDYVYATDVTLGYQK